LLIFKNYNTKKGDEMSYTLIHNSDNNQYEYQIEGHIAKIQYEVIDGKYHLTHTIVPKELGGRGIAKALTKDVLTALQSDGKKAVAGCSFIVKYKENNPEWNALFE
jgi:hypothetical protein